MTNIYIISQVIYAGILKKLKQQGWAGLYLLGPKYTRLGRHSRLRPAYRAAGLAQRIPAGLAGSLSRLGRCPVSAPAWAAGTPPRRGLPGSPPRLGRISSTLAWAARSPPPRLGRLVLQAGFSPGRDSSCRPRLPPGCQASRPGSLPRPKYAG
jgi:hypothetical protein